MRTTSPLLKTLSRSNREAISLTIDVMWLMRKILLSVDHKTQLLRAEGSGLFLTQEAATADFWLHLKSVHKCTRVEVTDRKQHETNNHFDLKIAQTALSSPFPERNYTDWTYKDISTCQCCTNKSTIMLNFSRQAKFFWGIKWPVYNDLVCMAARSGCQMTLNWLYLMSTWSKNL